MATADTPGAPSEAPRSEGPPPLVDRLTVGRLMDHGRERHEFHSRGAPSYYVKLLTNDGPKTIWGRGLESALTKSQTQPQLNDLIGVRQNSLDPVSSVHRERNGEGLVVATRTFDMPRPSWVVEKLEFFDQRLAAARALRDPSLPRREAVTSHPELLPMFWILDTARKFSTEKWQSPQTRAGFMSAMREVLATTLERGESIARLQSAFQSRREQPERPQERTR